MAAIPCHATIDVAKKNEEEENMFLIQRHKISFVHNALFQYSILHKDECIKMTLGVTTIEYPLVFTTIHSKVVLDVFLDKSTTAEILFGVTKSAQRTPA